MNAHARSGSRRIDMRRVILFVVAVVVPAGIYAALVHAGAPAWRQLGVHAIPPGFIDAGNITSAVDCARQGYDPLHVNPCDTYGRPMNYPRLWIQLFNVLRLGGGTTAAVGLAFGAAFFLAVALLARPRGLGGMVTWLLLLVSPIALLGLERGNNDLVVFAFLGAAVAAHRRGGFRGGAVAVAFWLVASLLKLYPVFAVVVFLLDPDRRVRRLAWAGVGVFAIYAASTLPDLLTIAQTVPHDQANAYGAELLLTDVPGLGLGAAHLILADLAFFLACAVVWRAVPSHVVGAQRASWELFAFRLGAAAFLGSFLLGANWDYRLVVLLLCVPLCLEWSRVPVLRRTAVTTLALMFLALGLPSGAVGVGTVGLHLSTWALGLVLVAMLRMSTAPGRLGQIVRSRSGSSAYPHPSSL